MMAMTTRSSISVNPKGREWRMDTFIVSKRFGLESAYKGEWGSANDSFTAQGAGVKRWTQFVTTFVEW